MTFGHSFDIIISYLGERETLRQIVPPTNCPACNSVLEFVNDQLFCLSDSCPAKSAKRVEHFAKTLKTDKNKSPTVETTWFAPDFAVLTYPSKVYREGLRILQENGTTVVSVNADVFVRPGPRMIDAIEDLFYILYSKR